jgi:hypothetical protein
MVASPHKRLAVPDGTSPIMDRAGNDYAVGHANVVLAYTKDNLAHLMYPGGVTRQDWVHDLSQLVTETW